MLEYLLAGVSRQALVKGKAGEVSLVNTSSASKYTNSSFGYHGACVSDDGSIVVVPAYGEVVGQGACHVYKKTGDTWHYLTKLQASDVAVNTYFGTSASISGDGKTIALGANAAAGKVASTGAAYIFKDMGAGYVQVAKLMASDGAANDSFGVSISITKDGSTVVVGAYTASAPKQASGAAYVFSATGGLSEGEIPQYAQVSKLVDGLSDGRHGSSVSISGNGNTLVVAAARHYSGSASIGCIYVYQKVGNTFENPVRITAADPGAGDYFGECVDISFDGETIIVGAPQNDDRSDNSGSVYVFKKTGATYSQFAKLSDGTPDTPSKQFGLYVALSDDAARIVAGSFQINKLFVFAKNALGAYELEHSWIPGVAPQLAISCKSVGISADGATVAIADPSFSSGIGRIHIYNL